MGKMLFVAHLLAAANVGLLLAQPQQAPPSTPSLGDLARQVKAERAKTAKQPVKVLTTDDFSSRPPEVNPSAESSTGTSTSSTGVTGGTGHDEKYYRKAIGDLRAKLETHRRELEVMQQKLGQNNMQYYADPNKALIQQFTRENVNKLAQDIEAKKQQIEADQKAIDDLQDQFRRQGGNAGALRDIMNAPVEQQAQPSASEPAANPKPEGDANPEDKKKSKDYWQAQFKAARDRVARAEEQQKLAEDELNLLQIQQARELAPDVQAEVSQRITAKKAELETNRAAADTAHKALDTLEAAFKNSGAPEDWRPQSN